MLCLADAIHNIKRMKIIQILQNVSQRFWNIAAWCHVLFLKCSKAVI